ncbi:TPA: plasmid recombination protein [Streptococcus suis]
MEKYSASHTTSRNSSLPHNRREEEHTGKNVDRNGIHEQWYRVEIEDLYDELFSDSIERYNAKQKRNDRKIVGGSRSYLAKVRDEWNSYYAKGIYNKEGQFVRHFNDYEDALKHLNYNKGKNPRSAYYESIVQIGNQKHQPDESICKAILKEYVDTFQERNPNLRLMEVHYHADEATPHIHLDFVPFATGYKQGMDVQNGFDKALMQQMDLERSGTKFKTPSIAWYQQEQKVLADIALSYGIEISSEKVLEPGKKEHESVKAYKARMDGLAELEDKEYELDLKEMEVNDKDVMIKNREYTSKRRIEEREKSLDAREATLDGRESILDKREAELARGVSQRLSEALRELRKVSEEKDRLEKENALKRAENAKLDVYSINQRDSIFLDWAKSNNNKEGIPFVTAMYNQFAKPWYDKQRTKRVQSGIHNAVDEYDRSKTYNPKQNIKQDGKGLEL